MTKYILAGGCDRLYPEYFRQLARVIQAEVAQPVILSCWFSMTDEESEARYPEYSEKMKKYFGDSTVITKADRTTFMEQVAGADVVYFHGGHTDILLTAMAGYENISNAFSGKIIVGSSAGANFLSRVGFSPGKAKAVTGAGIVDVVSIVHYISSGFNEQTFSPGFWDEAVRDVKELSGSDQVLFAT